MRIKWQNARKLWNSPKVTEKVRDRVKIKTFVWEVPTLILQALQSTADSISSPRTHQDWGSLGMPGLPRELPGLCAVAQGDSRRKKVTNPSAEAQ